MNNLIVLFASYGALKDNNTHQCCASDVRIALQKALNANAGVVQITNQSLGGDPRFGYPKQFDAAIQRNGKTVYFSDQEGQRIDFNHGGGAGSEAS